MLVSENVRQPARSARHALPRARVRKRRVRVPEPGEDLRVGSSQQADDARPRAPGRQPQGQLVRLLGERHGRLRCARRPRNPPGDVHSNVVRLK